MLTDRLDISRGELDQQLRARFDRPLRPKLRDVLRVVSRTDTPEIACRKLAASGIMEADFLSHPHRLFAPHSPGNRIPPSARPTPSKRIQSLAMVVAIASDEEGILLAESAAVEFANRLRPFQAIFDGKIVWYLTENLFRDSHPYETTILGQSFFAIEITVKLCLENAGIDLNPFGFSPSGPRMPLLMQEALAAWEGWRIAQQLDLAVTSDMWPVDRHQFQRFRDLPNPFSPLLDLWLTGYRISANFDEEDPAVHLYSDPSGIMQRW